MQTDTATWEAGIRLLVGWAAVLGAPCLVARSIWPRRPLLDQVLVGSILAVLLTSWWGYVLASLNGFTTSRLLVAYAACCAVLSIGAHLRLSWRGERADAPRGGAWPALLLVGVVAFLVRWDDPARHITLGGNDPWGHLALAKGVGEGDVLLPTHYYSFYPRGFHFLTVAVSRVGGASLYEVFRLSGPILGVYALLASFSLVRRVAGAWAGLAAAAFHALPPFRHWILACGDTAVEPDRLAFGMLACLSLMGLEVLERARTGVRYGNATALLIGGWVALFLVHPLSVELGTFLLVGLVVIGALISPSLRRPKLLATLLGGALAGVGLGAIWYVLSGQLWGVRLMSHLSDPHAVSLAGHGLDPSRLFIGTGFWGTWEDGAWLLSAVLVIAIGLRRRNPGVAYLGLACLLMGYSTITDALYLGDYGHAPPYYALSQAWASGALAGLCFSRAARRSLRLSSATIAVAAGSAGIAVIALRWPPSAGRVLAGILLLGGFGAAVGRPAVRRLGVAFFLCCLGTLWALSPRFGFYPHLGYEESVAAALDIAARHQEGGFLVYSQRLSSYTASGDAFPILNREKAVVEPLGAHRELEELIEEDPAHYVKPAPVVYVVLEKTPYAWSFHAFDAQHRARVMEEGWSWLAEYQAVRGIPPPAFERGEIVVYRL
jgi:hypothetical protein